MQQLILHITIVLSLLLSFTISEPVKIPLTVQHRYGYRNITRKIYNYNNPFHLYTTQTKLTGCYNTDFMIPATIGSTRNTVYNLIVDTGSTTLGVASSACSDCDGVQPTYTPSNNTKSSGTAQAKYGIGSFSGNIYADSVSVGNITSSVNVNLVAIDNNNNFFVSGTCSSPQTGQPPCMYAICIYHTSAINQAYHSTNMKHQN